MSGDADAALAALLALLDARGYAFTTPTPATHARVIARPGRDRARDVADILGWSLPFAPDLDPAIEALLGQAGMIEQADGLHRSLLRASTLHKRLYLHSAYPTEDEDAVFFGPDSYRFADLVRAELAHCPERGRIVDIGTGAGVGAIVAATACPAAHTMMTDINPKALRLARINAAHAGLEIEAIECEGLSAVDDPIHVAIANPPYIIDDAGRAYRDGGGMHGGEISLEMAQAAMDRLAPRGRLILYTGSAIVDGRDPLRDALSEAAAARGCTMAYREIDPDVFGEELDKPAYADVDRIAVIAGVFTRAD